MLGNLTKSLLQERTEEKMFYIIVLINDRDSVTIAAYPRNAVW